MNRIPASLRAWIPAIVATLVFFGIIVVSGGGNGMAKNRDWEAEYAACIARQPSLPLDPEPGLAECRPILPEKPKPDPEYEACLELRKVDGVTIMTDDLCMRYYVPFDAE